MKKNEICNVIELFREQKQMKIVDLVTDICSPRQYSRYNSGESQIPNKTLLMILDRLGVTITEFYNRYQMYYKSVRFKLMEHLKSLNLRHYDDIDNFLEGIDYELLQDTDIMIYNFLRGICDYYLKKQSKEHTIYLLKQLLDYPNCLDNEVFNIIEMNCIIHLIQLSKDKNLLKELSSLVNKMNDSINIEGFEWYDGTMLNLSLIQYYGQMGEHEKALTLTESELSDFGGRLELKVLNNLLMYKIASLKKINKFEEMKEVALILETTVKLETSDERVNSIRKGLLEINELD